MSNLKSQTLPLQKIAFCLFLLHLMIPSATPLSFKFPTISNYQNKIVLANEDSHFSTDGLQLTPDDYNTYLRQSKNGKATHITPLHLWDRRSGKLASFTTTFSFVIDSSGSSDYADGFTFFLAENTTEMTSGGYLGLPVEVSTNIAKARFVAVEFDTFDKNEWDPENMSYGPHVGIDVNSISSVAYQKWLTNIPLGLEYEATVSYYSVTKALSVVFTGYQGTTKVQQDALRYTVDLSKELPEWVNFGFTAATGGSTEIHTLKSCNVWMSIMKITLKRLD